MVRIAAGTAPRTITVRSGLKNDRNSYKPGYRTHHASMTKPLKYFVLLVAVSAFGASHAQEYEEDSEASPIDQVVPVADEPSEVAEADEAIDDDRTLDEQLAAEFERYRRLLGEDALDEADVSAKRIVEMVIRLHGPRSLETSKALNNLALVQSRNGQYDAAIQNFESAVEIIEDAEDRLNARLVNPLRGLGAAQLSSGRPDLARRTFDRATHITHVNEGPHNIEQVEILEALAQASLMMGETDGARAILDRIHSLNVRHFANDQLALIPSLMRRASWQHAARYYNDERATYRRAIRIIEDKLGKTDPQLILPLQKLGRSFYYLDMTQTETSQRQMVTSGETYFKRALRIAEQAPELHWREVADAKLALAENYTYVQSQNRARRLYRELWTFLSADEERLAYRAENLERPVPLFEDDLPRYAFGGADANTATDDLPTGTIRVDYVVSPRGRVRNIRTEAFPPEFTDMQRMVHREIRRRVYRPQITENGPQQSDNLVFEHRFFYRQADLDALRKENEEPVQPSSGESQDDGTDEQQ